MSPTSFATRAIHAISEEEHALLQHLRLHRRKARESDKKKAAAVPSTNTFGGRLADIFAATVGSWRFILIQSALLTAWILANIFGLLGEPWDPYPFILLNLMLSFQAAYAAPIIMMSQNRQSDLDRMRALDDYNINCKAELEIETLHAKIDILREQEIARLQTLVETLVARLEGKGQ